MTTTYSCNCREAERGLHSIAVGDRHPDQLGRLLRSWLSGELVYPKHGFPLPTPGPMTPALKYEDLPILPPKCITSSRTTRKTV